MNRFSGWKIGGSSRLLPSTHRCCSGSPALCWHLQLHEGRETSDLCVWSVPRRVWKYSVVDEFGATTIVEIIVSRLFPRLWSSLEGCRDESEDHVNWRTFGLVWLAFVHNHDVMWRGWCGRMFLFYGSQTDTTPSENLWSLCPLLCLRAVGIILWPFSALAIHIVVIVAFWSISATSRALLLQSHRFQ